MPRRRVHAMRGVDVGKHKHSCYIQPFHTYD